MAKNVKQDQFMVQKIMWDDFAPADFNNIDSDKTIAILPLAATEQHGPHLPITTDADIMDGMLNLLFQKISKFDVRIFPALRIGASDEHIRFASTRSISSQEMVEAIITRGIDANNHGIKKLILVNSHGGNEPAMAIAALELRKRFDMMVVKTSWGRFGVPDGLYADDELKIGIHGGDYETSLMLHFKPQHVDMTKAQNFKRATSAALKTFKHLSPQSPHGFGWLAGDLNPHGVVGNAAAATAQKGALTAAYQTDGFVELLHDLTRATLITPFQQDGKIDFPAL
ncbi:MAG: creatininase family protein [Ahrensia sp.]|nr:creatininase family protein [Ahrensia sp.]